MTTIHRERAQLGYALDENEGEAFWLLGMLQTIKIGRDDTDGQYGLVEIVVPEGVGSPWHVHPEEDEWFYVLEGEITFWVARHATVPEGRLVRVRPQGRAAHLLRRGRRSEGAGRLRADAVRGIPARSRRAGPRARPAATDRGPPGHGAARPDRKAKRVRDPRPARPPARTLSPPRAKEWAHSRCERAHSGETSQAVRRSRADYNYISPPSPPGSGFRVEPTGGPAFRNDA